MKLLTFLTTTTLLFLSQVLAAPVETTADSEVDSTSAGGADTQAFNVAANWGTPRCKSAMLEDLCISVNARAYCDGTGFHNDFPKSCDGVCYCA